MDDRDLDAFARAWHEAPDGWSGRRYADALIDAGRLDEAAAVHRSMWALGYPAGLTDLAWLQHDRGDVDAAVRTLRQVLPELDDEDRPAAEGTLGHWLWYLSNDIAAEHHLRAGLDAYPPARADLAGLLCATGREDEGRGLLEAGVAAGEVDSMLPLANLLEEEGRLEQAEALFRRAAALGDAHSAWNLAVLLESLDRSAEADEWRWEAARGGDEVAIRHLADHDDGPPTST